MFNTSQSCIPSKKHTRQLEPGPIWSYTSVSNPDIFFSYYPLSNTFSYFISLMQYQQPKRQKNIHSSRFVATCQSDETLQQKKRTPKRIAEPPHFCRKYVSMCMWRAETNNDVERDTGKNGHPPKTHYFKCWWKLELPIYIYIEYETWSTAYGLSYFCFQCVGGILLQN